MPPKSFQLVKQLIRGVSLPRVMHNYHNYAALVSQQCVKAVREIVLDATANTYPLPAVVPLLPILTEKRSAMPTYKIVDGRIYILC